MHAHPFRDQSPAAAPAGRFRRRLAALGVVTLAVVAATGTTGTAGAVTPTAPSYVRSWLALDTGATNTVRLVKADKTLSGAPQVLSAVKPCALDQGGAGLLALGSTPASPGVGFANGGIGVREKKTSSGTSCSAVDAASVESLTLKLGTGVGPLVAMSASLDMDLKQSARVQAKATLSTAPNAAPTYFELQSGASIGLPTSERGATVFTCNTPADSGPDSGANNNCRWEISAPSWTRAAVAGSTKAAIPEDGVVFDTLELKALTGAFSLMGGADGAVNDPDYPLPAYLGQDSLPATNDVSISSGSIFELVEGVIGCTETKTLSGTTVASSWKRLDNIDGSACSPFPYSSRTGKEADGTVFAEFTKPLDYQTKAQALWTTTFVVGGGTNTPPPPIDVVLDQLNGPPVPFPDLKACDSGYFDASTGLFKEPVTVTPESDPFACLVSAVRGSGKLSKSVTYTAYIYGDAGMRY